MDQVNFLNKKYFYSPLRYPGGKTQLFSFFDKIIKENKIQSTIYIEPFAGGAGAALALLFMEKVDSIIINDLDKAIYAFWKSAVFDTDRFTKKIVKTEISIKEWRKQKKIYLNPKSNCFDLGFSTFFLNRTNRSGIIEGGPIGGIKQKGKWKINARFNKVNLIERIKKVGLYKNRIKVYNEDGIELIKKFLNNKNTIIYLDPPYFEKGATLYLNHYKKDDHVLLSKCLNKNNKCKWILTYDDKQEIRELYSHRRIIDFSLNYNAYKARIGKELLILSDVLSI